MTIIRRVFTGAFVVGISAFLFWLFLPAITFASGGFWLFVFAVLIISTLSFLLVEAFDRKFVFSTVSVCILTIAIMAWMVSGITSWQCFHASRYQKLTDIQEASFSEDITDESLNIIVDVDSAKKLGDRVIGDVENSYWYEVDDEWNLCEINNKYYRVSPLNYAGLFKYNKASNVGIPGYVKINAQTQETEFVKLENAIMYSPSGYFSKNLERHLRHKYPSYVFGNSFFEVDDDGMAYYVTAVYDSTIGVYGGKIVQSVVITDANSGKCTEYQLAEIPDWIDHVYSVNYLAKQAYYYYGYVEGFVNFSKTGVYRTSYYYRSSGSETEEKFEGYNTTITKDGIVFYTGLTPANKSESNVGFLTLNPKTGEIKYYSCSGAEESSAKSAAEGLVQNMQYNACFPTIVNIDGEETYFMMLKDKQGLMQRYALCNVRNYNIVCQAETLDEVRKLYKAKLNGETTENITTNDILPQNDQEIHDIKQKNGIIEDLYTVQMDGDTYYFFNIINEQNLYMSNIKNNYRQVNLERGSLVEFSYFEIEDGIYEVVDINFD